MRIVEFDNPDQWHQWRAGGLGASDIASAATGSWGGAYGVVAKKLGRVPPEEENDQMRRGHRWEQTVADAVHVITGLYVVGEQAGVEHDTNPMWRYTTDGFLAYSPEATTDQVHGVYECKTTGLGVHHNWERTRLQVQWALLVSGLTVGLIAVATIDDGDDTCHGLRLEWVEADDLVQEDLIALADEMWTHITDGTLPEPEEASALPVVKKVYSAANPDAGVLDLQEISELVEGFNLLKTRASAFGLVADKFEAVIRDAMGEATKGAVDGFKVSLSAPAKKLTAEREAELLETHPEYAKTVLDRDRVKTNDPELYASFQAQVGARTLRVTPPKENT